MDGSNYGPAPNSAGSFELETANSQQVGTTLQLNTTMQHATREGVPPDFDLEFIDDEWRYVEIHPPIARADVLPSSTPLATFGSSEDRIALELALSESSRQRAGPSSTADSSSRKRPLPSHLEYPATRRPSSPYPEIDAVFEASVARLPPERWRRRLEETRSVGRGPSVEMRGMEGAGRRLNAELLPSNAYSVNSQTRQQHWASQLAVGAQVDLHVKGFGQQESSKWVRATVSRHHKRELPTEALKNITCEGVLEVTFPHEPPPSSCPQSSPEQRLQERVNDGCWATDGLHTTARIVYTGPRGHIARQAARHNPASLVGKAGKLVGLQGKTLRQPRAGRGYIFGQAVWVTGWLPALGRHVVTFAPVVAGLSAVAVDSVIVDLTTDELFLELFEGTGQADEVCVSSAAVAPLGTHTFVCQVCDVVGTKTNAPTHHWRPSRRPRRAARTAGARCMHETTCCDACVRKWVSQAVDSGKLYATCPETSCGRRFTVADVRATCPEAADRLAGAIKEAEWAAAADRLQDPGYDEWALTAQAKHCPQCHAAIEKNGGCDHMVCWRCGSDFQWKGAKAVSSQPTKPGPPPSDFSLDLLGVPPIRVSRMPRNGSGQLLGDARLGRTPTMPPAMAIEQPRPSSETRTSSRGGGWAMLDDMPTAELDMEFEFVWET